MTGGVMLSVATLAAQMQVQMSTSPLCGETLH